MKKFITTTLALIIILSVLPFQTVSAQNDNLSVAIVQLVSHPSLDEIHDGVIEGLSEIGYTEDENLEINSQNAEGDINLLNTIAQQVVSEQPDIIFAITTPVAQAFQNATDTIPILMAGVTDPVGSKLVDSIEQPGANITGVSDEMPLDIQFKFVQEIFPEAKKIGFMYTTDEDNSQSEAEDAAKAAEELGFETQVEGLSSTLDIQMVTANLAQDVDAIFIGSDNNIASSFETLLNEADAENVPVFSTIELMIAQGALGGVGIYQKQIGYQAGLLAKEIVDGKEPNDIPVEFVEDLQTMVNPDTLEAFDIGLPEDIAEDAIFIEAE